MHFKLFRHLDRPPQRVGLTVFEGADTAGKTESCLKAGRLPACPHPGAAPHWSVQSPPVLTCLEKHCFSGLQVPVKTISRRKRRQRLPLAPPAVYDGSFAEKRPSDLAGPLFYMA